MHNVRRDARAYSISTRRAPRCAGPPGGGRCVTARAAAFFCTAPFASSREPDILRLLTVWGLSTAVPRTGPSPTTAGPRQKCRRRPWRGLEAHISPDNQLHNVDDALGAVRIRPFGPVLRPGGGQLRERRGRSDPRSFACRLGPRGRGVWPATRRPAWLPAGPASTTTSTRKGTSLHSSQAPPPVGGCTPLVSGARPCGE